MIKYIKYLLILILLIFATSAFAGGPWYLRSADGGDGDDGLSWANACATMAGVLGKAVAAGDIIYVDDDHQETLAGDTTWTFPGTEGVPNKVIVVTTDTITAVSSYNCTNQYIEGDTNDAYIYITGEVYFWGICLELGDDAAYFSYGGKTQIYEKSKLKMDAAANDFLGVAQDNTTLVLINTDVEWTNAAQGFLLLNPSNFIWRGGTQTGDPNYLIYYSEEGSYCEITGVDASSIISGNLIRVTAGDERVRAYLKGLKLNATPPSFIDAGPERASRAQMDIADSGNTVYKFRHEFQYGYAMEEVTLTVDGMGLYDGANEFSTKLVSRAAPTCNLYDPWRYHLATRRVNVNNKTVTAYILQEGNGGTPTALTDAEVWLEVVYPDQSSAQFLFGNDRIATPTTAAAAQADDAGRWQNETNGREQKLAVAIGDVAKEGPVEFWICVAKSNTTIYVCPEVDIQ